MSTRRKGSSTLFPSCSIYLCLQLFHFPVSMTVRMSETVRTTIQQIDPSTREKLDGFEHPGILGNLLYGLRTLSMIKHVGSFSQLSSCHFLAGKIPASSTHAKQDLTPSKMRTRPGFKQCWGYDTIPCSGRLAWLA